jgi:hypothetical protein
VLVVINVLVLFAGTLFWPVWFYSEKLATLAPVWPLALFSALNAVLDAILAGIGLRSQLKAG